MGHRIFKVWAGFQHKQPVKNKPCSPLKKKRAAIAGGLPHLENPPAREEQKSLEHLSMYNYCSSRVVFYLGREPINAKYTNRSEHLEIIFRRHKAIISLTVLSISLGCCCIKEDECSHMNLRRLVQPLASAITVKCCDCGILSIVRTCYDYLAWEQKDFFHFVIKATLCRKWYLATTRLLIQIPGLCNYWLN